MAEQKDQPDHEEGGWQYKPEGSAAPVSVGATETTELRSHGSDENAIEWTASEFIAHQKDISWYIILAAGTVLISILVYLVTHDLINVLVLLLLGAMVGVTASRPPRIVSYRLDRGGFNYREIISSVWRFQILCRRKGWGICQYHDTAVKTF